MRIDLANGSQVEIEEQDLVGRRVRTTCRLRAHVMELPVGWEGIVSGTWSRGVILQKDPCDTCRIGISDLRVGLSAVVLISEPPG